MSSTQYATHQNVHRELWIIMSYSAFLASTRNQKNKFYYVIISGRHLNDGLAQKKIKQNKNK